MATTKVITGDTILVRATFKDINGININPDDNVIIFTLYDEAEEILETDNASQQSLGVYTFEWTVPDEEDIIYFLEMKGNFQAKPQLQRTRVKSRFKL